MEQAKHHVAEIEHVFDARKTAFDSSVAREKQIEEEKIKQISEDGCGILCDIKKAINGYVLIVLVLIKLILIVLVCFAAYKFYVCCKGQYRRV